MVSLWVWRRKDTEKPLGVFAGYALGICGRDLLGYANRNLLASIVGYRQNESDKIEALRGKCRAVTSKGSLIKSAMGFVYKSLRVRQIKAFSWGVCKGGESRFALQLRRQKGVAKAPRISILRKVGSKR